MTGRRTNLLLAVLVPLAALTGGAAFAVGTLAGRAIVVAHAVVGLGLVVVAPWKSVVVRRGLRRPRAGRLAAVALLVLVVLTVTTGVAHSAGVRSVALGVTAMQMHVGSALVSLALIAVHITARPVRPRPTDVSRRSLVRSGSVLAGAAALWVATEGAFSVARTAGASRRFTGSHEVGSHDPSAMPVTSWLNDTAPELDAGSFQLDVTTEDGTRRLTISDLEEHAEDVSATLDCTGGWYSVQRWHGPRLDAVLGQTSARSVVVTSATGYQRRFPMRDATALWLATRVGDEALSRGHGAPVRLVAPGRRGFWWVKWVVDVRSDDTPWWRQSPFPLT